VNNRICDGRNKRDRFAHFNDTYEYYVQVMWDSKQWVGEEIRLFYFAYVKIPRAKKSLNCDESEGDEHVEHVEKAMEQPKDSLHDPVKFQAAQDRFHPPEMYVFFHQGPAVIGGQNNVFLLQNPADMQKALQASGGGGRQAHRDHGSVDVHVEARGKSAYQQTISSY
jgi:hypothetical protein